MSNDSILYYENHANEFIESTFNVDMTSLYHEFEKYLTPGCKILDLGCGSGRDSRYFSEKKYEVIAIDPSPTMCEKTKEITNIPVILGKAEDLEFDNEFDAVWACASLLHVPKEKQVETLGAIARSLKNKGIVYCSWKYGDFERVDNGRHFTDMNEEVINVIVRQIRELSVLKLWRTEDVRANKSFQQWLNVLLIKDNLVSREEIKKAGNEKYSDCELVKE